MALTRITITIPADLVRAADKAAKSRDRSRSWVIADALRSTLAAPPAASRSATPAQPVAVRDVAVSPYSAVPDAAAFDAARRQHLAADLALSPGERAHLSDELAELAHNAQRRGPRRQVIAFDSYEEFAAWQALRRIGG